MQIPPEIIDKIKQAVDIVDKRLFDAAHAHILYRAQRLVFQLSLQRDAYVFQRIVRTLV